MSQEIQPNQDLKLICTENSDSNHDQGCKITLAEFITAAYGLDPCKLYYNRFGRLSPLPPQVQEVYMRLAKRMQITSKDTFGCTVLFGNEECSNIREENISKECKFHVRAYLKECENLSINPSQGYITRRLSKLNLYSSKEHLYVFSWMTIIPACVFIIVNFCFYLAGKASIHPLDSAIPYLSSSFALASILYLPFWEVLADSLEKPLKKHKFKCTSNINEIRLTITTLLNLHKSHSKICERIFALAKDNLKFEDRKEYVVTKLKKTANDLEKPQANHNVLSIENKSFLSKVESTENNNNKLKAENQELTVKNTHLTDSNHELTLKNSTLSNDLQQLQSKHNDLLVQVRLLSEKNESIEQEKKQLENTIQNLTTDKSELINQKEKLESKISQLETEKPSIVELKKSKKLNLYLIFLICELLLGKNIPASLQGVKGTQNAILGIGKFFDSLRERYPEHFKNLSRSNWYNIYPNLISFCFEEDKFDPRIIHRSYDGSCEPIEKVIDKL